MFKELTDRLNQTLASQEKLRKVTDKGWRDSTGWRFQRWNAAQRQLEVDSSRPPIPDDQMLDHLATILQCLKHPIVTRFRCKRKLMETHVSSGHLPQMSQCGHHVGHHEDSAEQRGVSIGGDGIQNGGIGFRGPGEAASRHDLPEEMSTSALHAQALQLVLINHGNTCYIECLDSGDGIMYDPRWYSMIEGWAEVHRQHDVCEFFTFLMKHCDCSLFSGSWQARMPAAAGDMRLIDAGLCTQPIILYIPQHRPNMAIPRLRSLVDDWHRCVDRFHGLQVVPPVLMLQLHRFQQQRGATIKNRGNVRLDDVISSTSFPGERRQHGASCAVYSCCIHRTSWGHTHFGPLHRDPGAGKILEL